ncbi:MAG: glycosyltransferase family 39 protein [Planctomycetes bacterium]|nr:glycosyltransferase family 39 protein [Planctomycetota bacterium]
MLNVRERGFAELLGPQPHNLVNPPMILWINRALFEIGGDGELLMRLPTFLAGIAALLLMIPLARKVVGGVHAVWAFAFLVICRHAISHGCETRPYTFDLLFTVSILNCVAILIDSTSGSKARKWAAAGLAIAAALGPWMSFPSAFVLGGASLALAYHIRENGTRRDWLLWVAFNAVVAFSGALLWWFSARHMYYTGMIEHWGHKGWWGFPDWSNPLGMVKWVISRPIDVGNYGNRSLGVLFAPLSVIGAFTLAKRSRALVVLLVAPFAMTLAAALIGKYPLAHRTGFFLLPCYWLLVACGISGLVAWGRLKGRELAFIGLMLIAYDFAFLVVKIVKPDGNLDYRRAYQFIHSQRKADDQIWSQSGVVYQVYYGRNAPLLADHEEFEEAVRRSKSQRLWVVWGHPRHDFQKRVEAGGGRVILRHQVSGLDVLLFEPADGAGNE